MTAAPFQGAAAGPAPQVGCVLGHEVGVLVVLTDAGPVRASYGARMLGSLARDRSCVPDVGEWVELRHWPDGPVTVERTLAPAARTPRPRLADVVRLDARRGGRSSQA